MKRALLSIGGIVTALVLLLAIVGALYRPPATIPPGVAGELLDLGGLRIRVLQSGAGGEIAA